MIPHSWGYPVHISGCSWIFGCIMCIMLIDLRIGMLIDRKIFGAYCSKYPASEFHRAKVQFAEWPWHLSHALWDPCENMATPETSVSAPHLITEKYCPSHGYSSDIPSHLWIISHVIVRMIVQWKISFSVLEFSSQNLCFPCVAENRVPSWADGLKRSSSSLRVYTKSAPSCHAEDSLLQVLSESKSSWGWNGKEPGWTKVHKSGEMGPCFAVVVSVLHPLITGTALSKWKSKAGVWLFDEDGCRNQNWGVATLTRLRTPLLAFRFEPTFC